MKFLFKVTQVNQEFLVKYPYAALDGDLIIIIKDSVFLADGVSLLGLALCINSWLIKVKTGSLPCFYFDYSSDEYTENPVLRLTKIGNHHYEIYSAWAVNHPAIILGLGEITHCFESFLLELDSYTQHAYGVALADMRFFENH
jgi:hypothetical protein